MEFSVSVRLFLVAFGQLRLLPSLTTIQTLIAYRRATFDLAPPKVGHVNEQPEECVEQPTDRRVAERLRDLRRDTCAQTPGLSARSPERITHRERVRAPSKKERGKVCLS